MTGQIRGGCCNSGSIDNRPVDSDGNPYGPEDLCCASHAGSIAPPPPTANCASGSKCKITYSLYTGTVVVCSHGSGMDCN